MFFHTPVETPALSEDHCRGAATADAHLHQDVPGLRGTGGTCYLSLCVGPRDLHEIEAQRCHVRINTRARIGPQRIGCVGRLSYAGACDDVIMALAARHMLVLHKKGLVEGAREDERKERR